MLFAGSLVPLLRRDWVGFLIYTLGWVITFFLSVVSIRVLLKNVFLLKGEDSLVFAFPLLVALVLYWTIMGRIYNSRYGRKLIKQGWEVVDIHGGTHDLLEAKWKMKVPKVDYRRLHQRSEKLSKNRHVPLKKEIVLVALALLLLVTLVFLINTLLGLIFILLIVSFVIMILYFPHLLEQKPLTAKQKVAKQHGEVASEVICPHCQTKGQVRTKESSRATGGGTVFNWLPTEYASITVASCGNCKQTWSWERE